MRMGMGMQTVHQRARSVIMFTVLLTGGVLAPCVATAATYYVATTGSDANPGSQSQPFRTIDKGVRALHGGDTLYLRGGTYANQNIGQHGPTPVPNGISWSNATTIAAYPGEKVIIVDGGISMVDGNSYIVFDGLHYDNGGLYLDCTAHHIRFQNGEFTTSQSSGAAMWIQGCGHHLEVLNSIISNAGGNAGKGCTDPYGCYGMYWGGKNSLFDKNRVYNNGGYGFHIYNSGSTDVSDNIISNSVFYGNGFTDLRGQTGCAFIISHGSRNKAYNNVIYNNGCGIQIDGECHDCEASNNTIYGNQEHGISINISDRVLVKNNIVYDNKNDIVDWTPGSTVLANNHLTANGDPRFVNAAANDFRLQATSPAKDAGVTLSAVPTDVTGLARPQGVRYDIGAYEYQVSTVPAPLPAPKNLRATSVVP
jgi:parallel beta-helix repeat protein